MKYCIICKEQIQKNAKICPHCGKYQNKWKNRIIFLATISGFLIISATFLTYTFDKINELIYNRINKDKLTVLQVDDLKGILMRNDGNNDVFISHLNAQVSYSINVDNVVSSSNMNLYRPIHESIGKGKYLMKKYGHPGLIRIENPSKEQLYEIHLDTTESKYLIKLEDVSFSDKETDNYNVKGTASLIYYASNSNKLDTLHIEDIRLSFWQIIEE